MFLNGDITFNLYRNNIKSGLHINELHNLFKKTNPVFKIFLTDILVVFLSRTFRRVQSQLQCLRTLVGMLPVFWSTKDTPYSSFISNSTQGFAHFILRRGKPVATVAALVLRAFIYLDPEKNGRQKETEKGCVLC